MQQDKNIIQEPAPRVGSKTVLRVGSKTVLREPSKTVGSYWVASFDIGYRNFAWWIESSCGRCIAWDHVDLIGTTSKKIDMQNALHSLSDYLLCHTNLWDKVDFFVIEKQMQFGRLRNPKAIRLGHHLESFFMLRYGRFAHVEEFPAYHKTQAFNAPKMNKPQRKKWAIQQAQERLLNRGDIYTLEKIMQIKKKDDVADCFLQALAWIKINRPGSK